MTGVIIREQAKDAINIEENTTNQAQNPNWFKYRQSRFTASLCNKIGDISKKTEKGLQSLAHNIVYGNKNLSNNKILQYKLGYGRFYEPIAIQSYETYMEMSNCKVVVNRCGLIVDPKHFVLGATPDGKVYDGISFGILEVKCTEHYKDIDPKDICFMSKDPCIIYDKETDSLHINKKHSYYNQVQMQLALSCQT